MLATHPGPEAAKLAQIIKLPPPFLTECKTFLNQATNVYFDLILQENNLTVVLWFPHMILTDSIVLLVSSLQLFVVLLNQCSPDDGLMNSDINHCKRGLLLLVCWSTTI